MAELFGFRITKKTDEKDIVSFTSPSSDDGTIEIPGGGFYSSVLDTDGRDRADIDLIRRYRDIAQQAECDTAIEDIVNEGIVSNESDISVQIELDNLPYPDRIKKKIRDEFEEVLRLLKFEEKGHDLFRRWYVDGRIYFHKIINGKNPKAGIAELRYIDPTKIKKVRQVEKDLDPETGIEKIKKIEEFYMYNDKGIEVAGGGVHGPNQGIKISDDSITYVPSGLIDGNSGRVLSYLQKAIKPVNQLRMIEDSLVIYRISRAPERRIFYIDVGNLPKMKAEQYLRDMMTKHKNRLVYDASTGDVKDDRRHMSMTDDFWLPRREGGKGTEITTLPGGQNLGELDDVLYFQKRLFKSLNVPISRMESDSGFSLGRATEISRDEIKFSKFISRLRSRFSTLFDKILEKQLILKGIIKPEEWGEIQSSIRYDFMQDNYFEELKESEVLRERLNLLRDIDDYVGKYYSAEWVRKNVLMMNEDEIETMRDQISQDEEDAEDAEDNIADDSGF